MILYNQSVHLFMYKILKYVFLRHEHCITTYIGLYYYSGNILTQIVPTKKFKEIVLFICLNCTQNHLYISYMI